MALTVSALADQVGLSADTVRYYERVGLLPKVIKTRPRLMAALATTLSGRATSTRPVVSAARP
jgi:hypothetical protein